MSYVSIKKYRLLLETLDGESYVAKDRYCKPLGLFDSRKAAISYAEKEYTPRQVFHVKKVRQLTRPTRISGF